MIKTYNSIGYKLVSMSKYTHNLLIAILTTVMIASQKGYIKYKPVLPLGVDQTSVYHQLHTVQNTTVATDRPYRPAEICVFSIID